MYTIHKTVLLPGVQTVELPTDAQILCVHRQQACITMWYELSVGRYGLPNYDTEERIFGVFGTGHSINYPKGKRTYLGTVFLDPYVWHVFHIKESSK